MTSARLTSPPRPLVLAGEPLTAVGRVRMYVCGVTPYDVTHLGHAATFVWADAAERVLRRAGHRVSVARNVTDVDEVLYEQAAARGTDATMLAALSRASFEATMAALRVRNPDHHPTAAQAVGNVIQLASALLARNAAYERDGSVYVRAAAAAQGFDDASARAREFREEPDDPAKDHPLDSLVWRGVQDGTRWPSPWGDGRPGWHAGCAAMVLSLFGSGVDLHCGGEDLAYPHHAVEALMAESATGVRPFARAWLRAGVVSVDGQKMAKSAGNLVLVDDLLRAWPPAVVRLHVLNRVWSQAWEYRAGELDRTAELLDQLYAAAGRPSTEGPDARSLNALLDDLDVPTALHVALEAGGATARELIDVLALG